MQTSGRSPIWVGTTLGLFVGLILGLFTGNYWFRTLLQCGLIGAAIGIIVDLGYRLSRYGQ